MYGQLNIKDKELPADFLEYFTKDGFEIEESPYAWDDVRDNVWIRRQGEIAFMFMSDEQMTAYNAMKRNWQGKVKSSFGIK